jgi:hypothetical protein
MDTLWTLYLAKEKARNDYEAALKEERDARRKANAARKTFETARLAYIEAGEAQQKGVAA